MIRHDVEYIMKEKRRIKAETLKDTSLISKSQKKRKKVDA